MPFDHRENSKLIWMIAGGLVAIILLVITYLWMSNTTEQKTQSVPNKVPAAQVQNSAPPLAQSAEQTISEPSTSTLVDEKILKDEVPKNDTAAKEEVAKLEDIQKQLDEQEQTLKAQHTDADQLIKLKEEQIKLLEQQLSQAHK
ncbi:hypothetical protein [Acinetobacter silvestris]|uniref:Uncharacterized protein n=1 Tax=Acinetobacter silvestris TaxID=1977882 RepID=A0A1Y3CJZ5_9GAMM|nr:hypothetical protein [Acinetobacter silvestris]OTG67439.1 hypothetical protein B9T28_02105 [Acinetobacter silvestris]